MDSRHTPCYSLSLAVTNIPRLAPKRSTGPRLRGPSGIFRRFPQSFGEDAPPGGASGTEDTMRRELSVRPAGGG